ncbi:MAG: hypothetical protein J5J00_14395 [Deltaproteobacteria bacterium]|nr:hypothetical protein [Deltaproteobacteria bacterium]
MSKQGKILVIYFHNLGYPLRKTNEQMIYCFERFSEHTVFFLNLAFPVPGYILEVNFDLVIFHDLLLCKRSLPRRFEFIKRNSQPLKRLAGYRIATVQDEFTQTKLLNDYLTEFDVRHIFSVAPPSEWPKIYPSLDRNKVKFDFCITGYLDDHEIERINNLAKEVGARDIDIGYRATPIRHSLGYIGYLKVKITEVFKEAAMGLPLKVDVSNDPKDAILGDNWYRFLLRCKYTLGVESGASVLDEDGSIEARVDQYLSQQPGASFEEISEKCLKGVDGNLKLQVVGPRHLEACLTRTCQILTEGEYNGILKPYVHYLPLRKDFSNVREILELVSKDELREKITQRAFEDIVLSRKYSFEQYVRGVLKSSLGENYRWSELSAKERMLYERNLKREQRLWRYVRLRTKIVNNILAFMPKKAIAALVGFMKRT